MTSAMRSESSRVFVDQDRVLLVCVGGDKEGYKDLTGRDWYDDYVPVADVVVDTYLRRMKP